MEFGRTGQITVYVPSPCGAGEQARHRVCTPPLYGGRPCVMYGLGDGVLSNWTDYSECTKPCDAGEQVRHRVCTPPLHGGRPCEGDMEVTRDCNIHPCPRMFFIYMNSFVFAFIQAKI